MTDKTRILTNADRYESRGNKDAADKLRRFAEEVETMRYDTD